MKFQVSKIPHINAAKHLAGLINKALAEANNMVLLSLAGGSAVDVYNEADALLDDSLNYSNLLVVMGDERWNIDPMHKDSDWLHFTQTSLYNFFATHNAKLINTLHGTNHKSEAAELDQLF
ncbi:6-phosphogluconolactonase, partial [Candidatus Dojkabacteria bacterium]|nr:6-phosphogluconolactonase [Candidatus Dojkabacteria bacterium]